MPLDAVTLENAHVRLEPIEERHRAPLCLAGDDPELWRFAGINQHGGNFDAWMDDRLTAQNRAGDLTFAVYDMKTQSYAGSSSFLEVSMPHKRLEIGWTWYAKKVWGGVVNPSCKVLLMTHGFEALKLNRIEFKLDATNERSWKAVERLGAKFEGVRRAHMVMPDGRVRDSAYFSVLASEWPAVKAGLNERLLKPQNDLQAPLAAGA